MLLCTWVTIELTFDTSLGIIIVLFVFARLPNSWMYCWAIIKLAACSPFYKIDVSFRNTTDQIYTQQSPLRSHSKPLKWLSVVLP